MSTYAQMSVESGDLPRRREVSMHVWFCAGPVQLTLHGCQDAKSCKDALPRSNDRDAA
jgi:hypothetical protein